MTIEFRGDENSEPDKDVWFLKEHVRQVAECRALIKDHFKEQADERGQHSSNFSLLTDLVRLLIQDVRYAEDQSTLASLQLDVASTRAKKAESDLESAVQPLNDQMARLNKLVSAFNIKFVLLDLISEHNLDELKAWSTSFQQAEGSGLSVSQVECADLAQLLDRFVELVELLKRPLNENGKPE